MNINLGSPPEFFSMGNLTEYPGFNLMQDKYKPVIYPLVFELVTWRNWKIFSQIKVHGLKQFCNSG